MKRMEDGGVRPWRMKKQKPENAESDISLDRNLRAIVKDGQIIDQCAPNI